MFRKLYYVSYFNGDYSDYDLYWSSADYNNVSTEWLKENNKDNNNSVKRSFIVDRVFGAIHKNDLQQALERYITKPNPN